MLHRFNASHILKSFVLLVAELAMLQIWATDFILIKTINTSCSGSEIYVKFQNEIGKAVISLLIVQF